MDILKVLIEFALTFALIYIVYYVFIIRKNKNNPEMVPTEVVLILAVHKIDAKKINIYQMVKVVGLVTTLILSSIVTIIGIFFDNTIILLIFGTLISLTVAVICYRIIGKHYEKISKQKK